MLQGLLYIYNWKVTLQELEASRTEQKCGPASLSSFALSYAQQLNTWSHVRHFWRRGVEQIENNVFTSRLQVWGKSTYDVKALNIYRTFSCKLLSPPKMAFRRAPYSNKYGIINVIRKAWWCHYSVWWDILINYGATMHLWEENKFSNTPSFVHRENDWQREEFLQGIYFGLRD